MADNLRDRRVLSGFARVRSTPEADPHDRCLVCSKVIPAYRYVGAKYCSRTCAVRGHRLTKAGIQPTGAWVDKRKGNGATQSAETRRKRSEAMLAHWARRRAEEVISKGGPR